MGVIFLISATLLFVSIFVIFRLFDNYKINNSQAIIVNYLVASIFSFIVYQGDISIMEIPQQSWFIPSVFLGVLFMFSFLLFAYSTQKAGVAITATASKMSVVIPVFVGAYLYEYENLSTTKVVGLLLAIASFYLIFKKDKTEDIDFKKILFPTLIFAFSGINDTLLKYIREIHFNSIEMDLNSEILFMTSLFSIAFIAGLVVFGSKSVYKKEKINLHTIIGGFVLGIFNFFSALTMFKAMAFYESAIFFPIFNVSIVAISAIIGILLFKEKMSLINKVGIFIALATILLLAMY